MGGGRTLRREETWEFAAWEIAQLGSCHLGKALGKLPNIIKNNE